MNMRNGIPIVQSVKKSKQTQGRLWKAIILTEKNKEALKNFGVKYS